MHADDARAQTRLADGIGHNLAVVLFVHPLLARIVGRRDQRAQTLDRVNGGHIRQRSRRRGGDPRTIIFRCCARQGLQWKVGHDGAVVFDQEPILVNCVAHNRKIEVPLFEHGAGFVLFLGLQHHQHALLRFRQHHFIGCHVLFALRDAFQI